MGKRGGAPCSAAAALAAAEIPAGQPRPGGERPRAGPGALARAGEGQHGQQPPGAAAPPAGGPGAPRLGRTGGFGAVLRWADLLNPDIPVQTDTEQFTALLRREGALPTGDPEGLALCAQALELYRGAFLEHTAPAPWLDAYRAQYARQFRTLAWRTLRRMDAVGADGPLELLCRRAAWAAPGDSALHGELIRCLAQYQRQVELIRHVAQLKLSRGKEQN